MDWQGSEKNGFTEYSLMAGASKLGKNYYVSKQFFRFIRPGAQRVDAKSSDPEVMAVAFSHPTMNAFTVVAINTGSSSKTLTLAGTGLPTEFQAVRTSATEDAVDLGKIAADAISLPASSITTLVNGSYRESDNPGTGGSGGSGGTTGTGGTTGSAGASGTGRGDGGPDAGDAGVGGRTGGSSGTGGRTSPGGTGGTSNGGRRAGATASGGLTAAGGTTIGTTNLGGTTSTGQGGAAGGSRLPDAGIAIGGSTAVPPTGTGSSWGALADAGANPISTNPVPDASAVAKSDSSGCGCQLGGPEHTTSTSWLLSLSLAGLTAVFARSGRKRSRR